MPAKPGRLAVMVCALLGLGVPVAAVGPEWVEGDDAGSSPGSAQTTVGSGQMARIRGSLTTLDTLGGGGRDLEDVYLIFISNPSQFFASTASDGGFSNFSSRLYLFDPQGLGLLGNQFPSGGSESGFSGATLENESTDGTGVVIDEPGFYLLGITASPREPMCMGQQIFSFDSFDEVSGPDGPAGGDCPLDDWGAELLGACCVSSSCIFVTEEDCDKAGGTYQGDGTDCKSVSCDFGGVAGLGGGNYIIALDGVMFAMPPAGIPTVSQWGLMLLGGGLLAATLILTRRPPRPVTA